jgi:hypothetical protein
MAIIERLSAPARRSLGVGRLRSPCSSRGAVRSSAAESMKAADPSRSLMPMPARGGAGVRASFSPWVVSSTATLRMQPRQSRGASP